MHRIIGTGLLPVLLAAPALAQRPETPPAPYTEYTEAELLSALDDSHPAVVEQLRRNDLARSEVLEARLLDDPVLGLRREEPSDEIQQTDWSLTWKLPDPDRRARIEEREARAEAVRHQVRRELLEMRAQIRAAYSSWALASARAGVLADQLERLRRLADREALRADRGESSGLAAGRLRLAVGRLEADLALATSSAEAARAEVERWEPELPADARPRLPDVPTRSTTEPPPHPAITAKESELAAAVLAQEAAGHRFPTPELTVGWQRQESAAGSIGGPTLGLTWSLPLFDRRRHERLAAEARAERAELRLQQQRHWLEGRRAAAVERLRVLSQSLRTALDRAEEGEELLTGAEASFRLGESSVTDLVSTAEDVLASSLSALDLYAAALEAHRDLERLTAPAATTLEEPEP